jgi:hypothetical protein
MRTKEEISKEIFRGTAYGNYVTDDIDRFSLMMEVLLDIRDLLSSPNQQENL